MTIARHRRAGGQRVILEVEVSERPADLYVPGNTCRCNSVLIRATVVRWSRHGVRWYNRTLTSIRPAYSVGPSGVSLVALTNPQGDNSHWRRRPPGSTGGDPPAYNPPGKQRHQRRIGRQVVAHVLYQSHSVHDPLQARADTRREVVGRGDDDRIAAPTETSQIPCAAPWMRYSVIRRRHPPSRPSIASGPARSGHATARPSSCAPRPPARPDASAPSHADEFIGILR